MERKPIEQGHPRLDLAGEWEADSFQVPLGFGATVSRPVSVLEKWLLAVRIGSAEEGWHCVYEQRVGVQEEDCSHER